MLVGALKKASPSRVIGIDTSTNSLAFCVMNQGGPEAWGKLNLTGSDIYERVKDAHKKARVISDLYEVDYVIVEGAIMGKSAGASLKIAMIVGASLSAILTDKTKVLTVAPISWQSFIGNKLLTKAEKQDIKDSNPGRSASWYKTKERETRKNKTISWVKSEYGIDVTDNDVSDAIGIAYWGVKNI